jgi:uncharacterized protein YodC (DUF2158 family)
MSVLQTALAYAKQDIRVIPIKQGEKRPPMQGWQNAATSDPTTIRTWFEGQFKDCGLGIATGEFRNRYLIVIDIDDRPEFSGSDTLNDLEQLHGQLPDTVEVITGSGGRHIYFLTDAPIRNEASGRLGRYRCQWHRRTSPKHHQQFIRTARHMNGLKVNQSRTHHQPTCRCGWC